MNRGTSLHWLDRVFVDYEDWARILEDCKVRKITETQWMLDAVHQRLVWMGPARD